jgi:dTDP-4-amino-4,6-dideoxygalactose transaminase
MKVKFLDLACQYESLKKDIDEAVQSVFKSAQFIKGEEVEKFEKAFSQYCGSDHCIGCANGTDALTYLLKAMNLKEGSTVIVPANTFIATAEAVLANGLKVKFADIDEDYNISVESVEKLIDNNVSAIVAVHLYGNPAKIDALKKISDDYGLKLIEDAAQAHGAEINGRKVGSLADGAAFSFYPGKVLGAAGDAGAVTVNDKKLEKKVRMLCDHGRSEKYFHDEAGANSRLDSIQAAVLNVKLRHLETWVKRRNEVADLYLELLKDVKNIELPLIGPGVRHAWHLFVIRSKQRDKLINYLKEEGIQCGIHYPIS